MAHGNDQFDLYHAAEPQDAAFDARDRALDARIGELLRETSRAPHGLSDRVFNASAALLPNRAEAPAPQLRFVPATSRRHRITARRRAISRLAMAASVALACAIGIKVCMPGATATTVASATSAETNWNVLGSGSFGYSEVSHLLETDSMSLDEVSGEIARLARLGESGM